MHYRVVRHFQVKLQRVEISNFRCLKEISIPFHSLTVLIGENDVGKSSILDLLEIALNGGYPDTKDYYLVNSYGDDGTIQTTIADSIDIIMTFHPEEDEIEQLGKYIGEDGTIVVRKEYEKGNNKPNIYIIGKKFYDDRLQHDFNRMQVAELDSLLHDFGIVLEGKPIKADKVQVLEAYKANARSEEDWIETPTASIRDILPRFDRYRAMDYQNPEMLVQKTLRSVFETIVYESVEGGINTLVPNLLEVKRHAQLQFNDKVRELLAFIQQYNPTIRDINYEPVIDFIGGLKPGEFQLDDGHGFFPLSKKGDGTKRRMLMAAFDWDRQVQVEQASSARRVIRGYDEPDTNLHYDAQRTMYQAIADITNVDQASVQAVICTHSLLMLDRAPAKSINVLHQINGATEVDYLITDEDVEVDDFLSMMARQLGITNTVLFYERCYLLVEGDTEEVALPVLYRRKYGHTMLDDGIRIINIGGQGIWLPFLRLLSKNRQELTVSLLDTDAQEDNRVKFRNAGFDERLWEAQTYWIGTKEFEDAFSNETWTTCLTDNYARIDNFPWELDHFEALRRQSARRNRDIDKFSEQLVSKVRNEARGGQHCNKRDLGMTIGRVCPLEAIPYPLIAIFEHAQKISNGYPEDDALELDAHKATSD